MDTIVVTGGAGFIGANFVRHALAHSDARVVVFDKLTYAGNLASLSDVASSPRYAFVQGDIADREAVRALLRAQRPSAVVNFAAETHVDRSIDDPASFVRTNVTGAFELLEAARLLSARAPEREASASCTSRPTRSTARSAPRGRSPRRRPTRPTRPTRPPRPAPTTWCARTTRRTGLPVLLTNCSNNYGPFQFPEKLIPLMILNAVEARKLPIYGDGGNVRDWLYVDDHCEGILLALQKGAPGSKYNIGGGNERTNLQVVDALCAALDAELPAAKNPALASAGMRSYAELKSFVPDRPGHDRRYAIDASKIRAELGWTPRHAFESGLRETVRWYLANKPWCEAVQSGKYRRERLGLTS